MVAKSVPIQEVDDNIEEDTVEEDEMTVYKEQELSVTG